MVLNYFLEQYDLKSVIADAQVTESYCSLENFIPEYSGIFRELTKNNSMLQFIFSTKAYNHYPGLFCCDLAAI